MRGAEAKSRRWPEAFKPISPLLYGAGKALEEKKVSELQSQAAEYHDFNKYDPQLHLGRAGKKSFKNLREVIEAQISAKRKGFIFQAHFALSGSNEGATSEFGTLKE